MVIGNSHELSQKIAMVSTQKGSNWETCSGTLLADKIHIVTAAHCFMNRTGVVLASVAGQDRRVDINRIRMHPKFNPDALKNPWSVQPPHDLAIIAVSKPFQVGTEPVLLPSETSEPLNVGQNVIVAGFGSDSEAEEGILKRMMVPLESKDQTKMTLETSAGQFRVEFGDSGGPLFLFVNKRYVLQGVISHTQRVRQRDVYTDVKLYENWIRTTVSQLQ